MPVSAAVSSAAAVVGVVGEQRHAHAGADVEVIAGHRWAG
jgi:hypothetical protein